MTLLLTSAPLVAATPLDSLTSRAALLTDAEVSALAAEQDMLDIVSRFDALNAVADVDLIDVEFPIAAAFHRRPTSGQTTPTEDRLAFEALRDAALAYTTEVLAPVHHVVLTSAWVRAVQ